MKTLVLDTDRSLASIGGADGAEALLGFQPVPITHGLSDVKQVLNKLLVKKEAKVSHPFLNDVSETRMVPNGHAQELGLECLVIDTASTLAEQQFERDLASLNARRAQNCQSKVDSLDQSTWGPYANRLLKLWRGLAEASLTVVVTCHEARKEDDSGFATYEPNIKGSSATKMLRFFDAVLFAEIVGSGEGAEYVWRVSGVAGKPAKARGLTLPPTIPQDFGPLLTAFREAGTPHPCLLVIGESGTGKTTALRTLADA